MFTEQTLFDMLRDTYHSDLAKASDEYSTYDCYSASAEMFFELKCRDTHYDELMIEKSKYDRLVALAAEYDYTPIYVCSTPEGVWEFDLSFIDIQWEDRGDLPATSQFENQERVTKQVGYLDIGNVWATKIYPIDFEMFDPDDTFELAMQSSWDDDYDGWVSL